MSIRKLQWMMAALLTALVPVALAASNDDLGVGIAVPPIDPDQPLTFYSHPRSGQVGNVLGIVRFQTGETSVDIASAPPWFSPETLKLDYELLQLRALRLRKNWIEVIVNHADPLPRTFPRTAWVERSAVSFEPWSEYLLRVYSIEPSDPSDNPLRSGPGDSYPSFDIDYRGDFRVLSVQGSWAEVEAADFSEQPARGWIRWRQGDRLTIEISLLS